MKLRKETQAGNRHGIPTAAAKFTAAAGIILGAGVQDLITLPALVSVAFTA